MLQSSYHLMPTSALMVNSDYNTRLLNTKLKGFSYRLQWHMHWKELNSLLS